MISNEKLVEINNRMLSLGAPIERDNMGYNTPDYALCFNMAYIPSNEISPVMAFAMVETMLHYKNTQLSDICEELEESKKELEKILSKSESEKYKMLVKGANISYLPESKAKVLNFVGYDEDLGIVEVYHSGWCGPEQDFKKERKDFVKSVNRGNLVAAKWDTCVSILILDEYLSLMNKVGFVFDANLTNFVRQLDIYRKEFDDGRLAREERIKQQEIEKHTVDVLAAKEDGVTLGFRGYEPSLKDFVSEYASNGVHWVKRKDTYGVFLPNKMYVVFKKVYTAKGYIFDNVDEKSIKKAMTLAKKALINPYKMIPVEETDFPYSLYDYQVEDIKAALMSKRKLLGHDMGCGKTAMSVFIGESIKVGKKLIVCPASLRLNWKKEILTVNNSADVKILYSKDDIETFEFGRDYTIVGYATLVKYVNELCSWAPDCVFVDEVHNCKAVNNSGKPNSKTAAAAIKIALIAEYCYILTGTPIPSRNKDLFNILRMMKDDNPSTQKFFTYGRAFCDGYQTDFGWNFNGNSNQSALHDILAKHMIRRLKKDVLPDLTKQRVFIPFLSTKRAYKLIEKRFDAFQGHVSKEKFIALAMEARQALSAEKSDMAIDMARSFVEEGRSVVIVSNFNNILDKIKDAFGGNCCEIRGGMTDKAKEKAKEDFQSGKIQVCALNIKAGGTGVTLTKAHDMIIADYDFLPSNMTQVEDRICRCGQTEPCTIHYIYCENSIFDSMFVSLLTEKSENSDMVVDGANGQTLNLADELNSSYFDRLSKYVESKSSSKD